MQLPTNYKEISDLRSEAVSFHPSPRKLALREHADRYAPERDRWIERNAYFHADDTRYMKFLVPEGLRVLDCGCGAGDLLSALKPSRGVGIDLSRRMIEIANTASRARVHCR